jgi:hypothetical protein
MAAAGYGVVPSLFFARLGMKTFIVSPSPEIPSRRTHRPDRASDRLSVMPGHLQIGTVERDLHELKHACWSSI